MNESMHSDTVAHIFENRNIKGNTKDQLLAVSDIVRYVGIAVQDCQYATDREWEEVLGSMGGDILKKASMAIKVSRQMRSQVSRYPSEQK